MRKAILAGVLGILMGAGLLAAQGVQAAPTYLGQCGDVADVVVGSDSHVCVDTGLGTFEGGALMVGGGGSGRLCDPVQGETASPLPGVYVIADGDNNNDANLSGYAGISTAETAGTESCYPINQQDGTGTNSGGSFGLKAVPGASLPLPIACGFTSSPDFGNTDRDGCYIP